MLLRTFDLTHPYSRAELAWAAGGTFAHVLLAGLCVAGAVVIGGWTATHEGLSLATFVGAAAAVALGGAGVHLLLPRSAPLARYLRPAMPLSFRKAGMASALSILDACFEHDEVEVYRRTVVSQRRPLTELEAILILMCFDAPGPLPREPDLTRLEIALFGE